MTNGKWQMTKGQRKTDKENEKGNGNGNKETEREH